MAGITFRTESSVALPRLDEEPFALFRVEDKDRPDVRHRIHRVALDSLTLPPLSQEERETLTQHARVEPGGLEAAPLRSPAVRAWVDDNLARSTDVGLWLHPDLVMGQDFARRTLELFYPEDYGQDRGRVAPETWLPAGENDRPEPRFRMHQVDLDPWTAPPLPEAEQARFARGIGFSPPDMVDHPFLRTPLLRAWLHGSLDRGEQLDATIHMDGILVWNVDQSRQDFFYWPEYGDSPEGYVAVHLRQIFAAFLPDFSALLVHASGLIRNGRAALFLAPDEGGKTTVLRNAAGGLLLNDDQVILRQEAGTLVAHGTPLGRLTSGPCQARLGAFFVLEKARSFELTPEKPADLARYLWEEHQVYISLLPRRLKLRAFDLFCEACQQTPVYRMRFPRDRVDWDAVDAAMD